MKYLLTLFLALIICVFLVGVAYLQGIDVNFLHLILSFIFGILFMPLVIRRLPVFKHYYFKSIDIIESKNNSLADRKAAPVMCAIVAAFSLAGIFYVFGSENYWFSCFMGGVAAGAISFYYEL